MIQVLLTSLGTYSDPGCVLWQPSVSLRQPFQWWCSMEEFPWPWLFLQYSKRGTVRKAHVIRRTRNALYCFFYGISAG